MINAQQRKHALQLAKDRFQKSAAQKPQSFLSLTQLDKKTMLSLIHLGLEMKHKPENFRAALQNKSVALLFQKTSTRTRCSFENAVAELGGFPSYIDWRSSNFVLSDLRDEIKSLSRYYDMIVARVNEHETLEIMAEYSEVPVINGLSNRMHPCQALGDFLTMTEYFGHDLNGLRMTYIGDGNNVCRSLVHGAITLGVRMTLCNPKPYALDEETVAAGKDLITRVEMPKDAVRNADVIYTDTWISMGDEHEMAERLAIFQPYQVNASVIAAAPKHALIMHCLPAHPEQEITAEVLRSSRSIVFDQAENRQHAQKALLEQLATNRLKSFSP